MIFRPEIRHFVFLTIKSLQKYVQFAKTGVFLGHFFAQKYDRLKLTISSIPLSSARSLPQ